MCVCVFAQLPIVFMVLGVSYLRVLAQRPTGCCSASYYKMYTRDVGPTTGTILK